MFQIFMFKRVMHGQDGFFFCGKPVCLYQLFRNDIANLRTELGEGVIDQFPHGFDRYIFFHGVNRLDCMFFCMRAKDDLIGRNRLAMFVPFSCNRDDRTEFKLLFIIRLVKKDSADQVISD